VVDGDLKRASRYTNNFHWNRLWQKGIDNSAEHKYRERDEK
jgi:hypothetical protein